MDAIAGMPAAAVVWIVLFALGYVVPMCIEFYEGLRRPRASVGDGGPVASDEGRVSPFSVKPGAFTAFSAIAVGLSGYLIYKWTGGRIDLSDRDLATVAALAATASAFAAFVIVKWIEGVSSVLGYTWENTVVARRKRIRAEAKAEARSELEEELKQKTEELRQKSEEARQNAEDARQNAAEAQQKAEEARMIAEENARLRARLAEYERERNGSGPNSAGGD